MAPENSLASIVAKTVRMAILTTIVCEDGSTYVVEAAAAFVAGDSIDIREGEGKQVWLRRAGDTAWFSAVQVRPFGPLQDLQGVIP